MGNAYFCCKRVASSRVDSKEVLEKVQSDFEQCFRCLSKAAHQEPNDMRIWKAIQVGTQGRNRRRLVLGTEARGGERGVAGGVVCVLHWAAGEGREPRCSSDHPLHRVKVKQGVA